MEKKDRNNIKLILKDLVMYGFGFALAPMKEKELVKSVNRAYILLKPYLKKCEKLEEEIKKLRAMEKAFEPWFLIRPVFIFTVVTNYYCYYKEHKNILWVIKETYRYW